MKILNWFWYAAFIEKKWQIASINVPSVIEPRIELDLSNAQIFPKFPGVSIVLNFASSFLTRLNLRGD